LLTGVDLNSTLDSSRGRNQPTEFHRGSSISVEEVVARIKVRIIRIVSRIFRVGTRIPPQTQRQHRKDRYGRQLQIGRSAKSDQQKSGNAKQETNLIERLQYLVRLIHIG
jgi:hypothetical protein